jgi:prevent-host-death family protein
LPTSTISAREFNQHVSRAKRAANDGPVIITERGKPAYVLMRHDLFAKTAAKPKRSVNAFDALTDPNATDFDVEFPRMSIELRPVDLS